MSQASSIEWTDATWNPVRGCTKVSPGCKNCYAETFAERWRGIAGHPYEQGFDLRLVPEKLAEPLKWKKPRLVFVNSMSDLWHKDVPEDFIRAVYTTMAQTPQHTYQILTKRADRRREVLARWKRDGLTLREGHGSVLPNVWEGVSVENQEYANERLIHLRDTPAVVRFVSYEPALGPWDPRRTYAGNMNVNALEWLNWIIVGGESGPGARSFDVEWARTVVGQCREARVACFVKQLGARPFAVEGSVAARNWMPNGRDGVGLMDDCGLVHLKSRKGGDPDEWPGELRVRQWPTGAS